MDAPARTREVVGTAAACAGANVLQAAAGLAAIVWLTRALAPDRYGVYVLVQAHVGFFQTLGTLGLGPILLRELGRGTPRAVGEIFGLHLALSGLAFSLSTLSGALLYEAPTARLVALWGLALGLLPFHALGAAAIARRRGGILLGTEALRGATHLGGLFVALRLGLGLPGVLAASLVALAVSSVLPVAYAFASFSCRPRADFARWRALLSEAFPLGVNTLLGSASALFALQLLESSGGGEAAAHFGAPYRFLLGFLVFLPHALSQTATPILAGGEGGGRTALLRGSTNLLAALAVPVAVAGALGARDACRAIFGPAFEPAAPAFALTALALAVVYVGYLPGQLFVIEGRVPRLLRATAAGAAVGIGAAALLVPRHGAAGAALALLLDKSVLVAVLLLLAKERFALTRALAAPRFLRPSLLGGLAMAAVLSASAGSGLFSLALGAGAFAAAAALSLLSR